MILIFSYYITLFIIIFILFCLFQRFYRKHIRPSNRSDSDNQDRGSLVFLLNGQTSADTGKYDEPLEQIPHPTCHSHWTETLQITSYIPPHAYAFLDFDFDFQPSLFILKHPSGSYLLYVNCALLSPSSVGHSAIAASWPGLVESWYWHQVNYPWKKQVS